jgi:hypothetical protein
MKAIRNSMLVSLSIAALALVAVAPVAYADSLIIQSASYGPQSPTYTDQIMTGSILKFDTSLGTLNSVTIKFTGGISGTIQSTNNGLGATTINSQELGFLTLDSVNPNIDALISGDMLTVLSSHAIDTALGAGATGPVHNVSGTNYESFLISASDFALFEGAGYLDPFLLSTTSSISISAGNSQGNSEYTMLADGTAMITYDYTPGDEPPVPEPGTLSLFGTGLLGLAGMLRYRFMKAS